MRSPLAVAFGLVLALLAMSGVALASCPTENSICYKFLRRYIYNGGAFCSRYGEDATILYGTRGSTSTISNALLSQTVFNAYSEWYFAASLPLYLITAGSDTGGTNSRVAFLSEVEWQAADLEGALGYSPSALYSDGTHKYSRMYLRGENGEMDFIEDCVNTPCNGYSQIDLTGIVTHEIGHWWGLGHEQPSATWALCDTTTMWHAASDAWVAARTVSTWDQEAIYRLYQGATVEVSLFSATQGVGTDTLRWEESDPFGTYTYELRVSDSCWGPFSLFVTVASGDPTYTSDGVHYTYVRTAQFNRPYVYALTVQETGKRVEAVSNHTTGFPPNPPDTPTGLAAELELSEHGVHVSWEESGGGPVAAYYLYRYIRPLTSCTVDAGEPAKIKMFGPLTATEVVDVNPPVGDILYYRVRATNSQGGSLPSLEATADLTELVGVGEDVGSGNDRINYVAPNPAREKVDVTFTLVRASHTQIGVYDLAGRQVALLLDGYRQAGIQSIPWTPTNAVHRGGMYFVRLMVDGRPVSRKRVLIVP